MTSNIKHEEQAEVRQMGDEKFGVFLVQGGIVVDCVAEYKGPRSYEFSCLNAHGRGRPWRSNVPGDLPQAQSNLSDPPFLMIVKGNAVIHDGVTAEPFADTWTGVCCDCSVKSFWYIGREQNERSFNKLIAKDYLEAVQEARDLVKSMKSADRYPGAQSLVQAVSERYPTVDDARDALTTIGASTGFVFGYVDEHHRRTVTFHVADTSATDLPGKGLLRVFSLARESSPAIAA